MRGWAGGVGGGLVLLPKPGLTCVWWVAASVWECDRSCRGALVAFVSLLLTGGAVCAGQRLTVPLLWASVVSWGLERAPLKGRQPAKAVNNCHCDVMSAQIYKYLLTSWIAPHKPCTSMAWVLVVRSPQGMFIVLLGSVSGT
jgi:hypothetical protein